MSNTATNHNRYMPGLDALRAFAVISVIAYHLKFPWASGGFLGVTVFFVLSGYLITDLLIAEWSRNKKIDLKNFWIRRARRLLPGVFTLLIVVIAWVSLFQPFYLSNLKQDSIAAIFYYSNWWYIFHHLSYFESFANPSLLNHFWSLAVEEQFYIIWPIIILLGLHFLKRKAYLFLLTIIGAVISSILMAKLFHPGFDPSRVYYGTDTRAFSLLIGAGLAFIWPSRKLSLHINKASVLTIDLMGITGLIIFMLMVKMTNQYDDFLYRGGMVLLSISTAMLIASLAHPTSHIGKFLAMKPLKWIGLRSYGIYLWHYPVIVLMSPRINTNDVNFIRGISQLIIIFILAAFSYRFIEDPIRKGRLELIMKKLVSGQWSMKDVCFKHIAIVTSVIVLFSISSFGIIDLPGVNDAKASSEIDSVSTLPKQSPNPVDKNKEIPNSSNVISDGTKPYPPQVFDKKNNNQTQLPINNDKTKNTTKPANSNNQNNGATDRNGSTTVSSTPQSNANKTITIIGDSVVINAIPYLKKSYPKLSVDAKIGRQFTEATKIIPQFKKTNSLGDTVVIELGTNGAFSQKQMISVINLIGNKKKIIFVNTRVPRPWEPVVNRTLKEVSAKYPNTMVVNWYAASANHNSYFSNDGVHLKPSGAQVFASLLKKAIDNR